MKRVRIVSDGTFNGSHIYDESGEEIHARSAHWTLSPDEPVAYAELVVPMAKVDVEADAVIIGRCPHCGRMEDIEDLA